MRGRVQQSWRLDRAKYILQILQMSAKEACYCRGSYLLRSTGALQNSVVVMLVILRHFFFYRRAHVGNRL